MKAAIATAGAIASLFLFSPARTQEADSFKAISLSVACAPPPTATPAQRHDAEMICDAFMRGITEGMFVMQVVQNQGLKTCLPSDTNVDRKDAIAILEREIQTRPRTMMGTAGVIMATALLKAYPCPASK